MGESPALINRSLTTIFNELEFLKDSNIITADLFEQLTNHIPKRYSPGQPAIGPIGSSNGGQQQQQQAPRDSAPPSHAPTPVDEKQSLVPVSSSNEVVEALYDYRPSDPADLELRQGCRVEVLEKTNQDWWKGRNQATGQVGLFPSNYVRSANDGSRRPPAQAPVQSQSYGPPGYGPPPMQQQPSGSYMPPFPQYTQQDLGAPQQQPQQVIVQQQQPQEEHHSAGGQAFKKFGSKLGNAAIFGAGATIGSDIVNSIF